VKSPLINFPSARSESKVKKKALSGYKHKLTALERVRKLQNLMVDHHISHFRHYREAVVDPEVCSLFFQ